MDHAYGRCKEQEKEEPDLWKKDMVLTGAPSESNSNDVKEKKESFPHFMVLIQ